MSVIISSCEQIAHSPTNRSQAKQLYSFAKSERFSSPRARGRYNFLLLLRCDNFYDLPSTRPPRTTTFGIGTRARLTKSDCSPPPNTYTLPSDFDRSSQKGRVFSFGISRDAYARVYVKAHPAPDLGLPGPGTYSVREIPGKDALKYSLRPRTSAQGIFYQNNYGSSRTASAHSRTWDL